jgi:hypothetical protein
MENMGVGYKMLNNFVFYAGNEQKIEFYITKNCLRLIVFRESKYLILEFKNDEVKRFIHLMNNLIKIIE